MKKAKTDLFLSSIKSFAILSCKKIIIISYVIVLGHTVPCRYLEITLKDTYNAFYKSTNKNTVWTHYNYLLSSFIIGYISSYSKWPFDMEVIFFQSQQKYNQDKQGVQHKESKHWLITQFL